jgi:hypothetical protein
MDRAVIPPPIPAESIGANANFPASCDTILPRVFTRDRSGDLMNIRRILQPMGLRFFLLVIVMFQLFKLTTLLPESMYWPSHIAALLIGLLFWRLMLKVAKTEQ